ncbi:MAG: hypothetical protein KKH83_05420, partial [Candidatus Margulisbacteria bacterium]|nr:hypothetical protein [Candidatus Margulisiibacteriota bacterium]
LGGIEWDKIPTASGGFRLVPRLTISKGTGVKSQGKVGLHSTGSEKAAIFVGDVDLAGDLTITSGNIALDQGASISFGDQQFSISPDGTISGARIAAPFELSGSINGMADPLAKQGIIVGENASNGYGIQGINTEANGTGIFGSSSKTGTGASGYNANTTASDLNIGTSGFTRSGGFGGYFQALGTTGTGLKAIAGTGAGSKAAIFEGDVDINSGNINMEDGSTINIGSRSISITTDGQLAVDGATISGGTGSIPDPFHLSKSRTVATIQGTNTYPTDGENPGVEGISNLGYGVVGRSSSQQRAAVYAVNERTASGDNVALLAQSIYGIPIYATNTTAVKPTLYLQNRASNGQAAQILGGVSITGDLNATSPNGNINITSGRISVSNALGDQNAGVIYGASTGIGSGLMGTSTGGNGVYGTSTSGNGLSGMTTSANRAGVRGFSSAAPSGADLAPGVKGVSSNGTGVTGEGPVAGVQGTSVDGQGIRGTSTNSYGVYGESSLNNGGYFTTKAVNRSALYAVGNAGHYGEIGGIERGVVGYHSNGNYGGLGNNQEGVWGAAATAGSVGVVGRGNSTTGIGVAGFGGGRARNVTGGEGAGVFGLSDGHGIHGVSGGVTSIAGRTAPAAIFAESADNNALVAYTNNGTGVYGYSIGGFGGQFTGTTGLYASGNPAIEANGNIMPQNDNSSNLGSSSKRYRGIYAVTTQFTSTRLETADLNEKYAMSEAVENGDVVVISGEKIMSKCSLPNDSRVAGVVKKEGGITLDENLENGVPVALVGKVLCNVDAEYGEVFVGDLLTTSPTLGHAMKAVDPKPGTIVGKALESLKSGKKQILVLVTLQ